MEGGTDGGGAAIENQFAPVLRALDARVEEIAAEFEIILESILPGTVLRVEHLAQALAAAVDLPAILDLHAGAVVGHDGENVCAGPGALAGPERLEQTNSEREETEQFQKEAGGEQRG